MIQAFLLLGVATGMRTMTPIAVVCWCAYLRLLPQHGWGMWAGYLVSAVVFGVLALGEYVGDTLPKTPSRISVQALIPRLIFGTLAVSLAANAMGQPVWGGVVFGLAGALVGAYGGYFVRMRLARLVGRDLPVALCESALALGMALLAAYVLHGAYLLEPVAL